MVYDNDNIFAKILRGEAPAFKVYEDDFSLAFMDVMPQVAREAHTAGGTSFANSIRDAVNAPLPAELKTHCRLKLGVGVMVCV